MLQRTLKESFTLKGIGLHSGRAAAVTARPAVPNTGILFVRTDLPGTPSVKAKVEHVVNTQLATTLGDGSCRVSTVEHLLSAFLAFGVDNAVVEVDGPEIPILDGSAREFARAILSVGTESLLQYRRVIQVLRRVEVKLDGKWAVIEPSNGFEVHASIDWDHPLIGFQEFVYEQGRTEPEDILDCRTFGMLEDVEGLRRMGLALGGSLDNAIVLDRAAVLNPGGLRSADEFVRHKVLDAMGDLALAGMPLQGRVRLHRSGHDLHSKLLAALLSDPRNYEVRELSGADSEAQGAEAPASLALAYS
ncbi:MAG: UDP-3-O-acyl-N-acetylglucosamine deacetylase [Bdellovibrionales bacterium]|nr:UDP-3-O-acyl-N-acetylglucosamine deacetylase [Bdellovibrionales bacterium]